MTPYECLVFAARMRTSLSAERREKKVQDILERLNLLKCAHTKFGGVGSKGLSGGEKKRCSVGYELITDPKVLLLDEPTSGLDSSSSLKIMRQMRREAQRGRAVLATIHQPSTELFQLFHKVIFMCNGHIVYQGSVQNISHYLAEQSIEIAKFSNPADFVIRAIQAPHTVKKGLTKDDLVLFYRNKYDHV